MVSKTKQQFFKDGFKKLMQLWRKCIEVQCVAMLWKNNYTTLKIIDVGIYLFFISLKYLFPFIFYLSGGKTYQPALILRKVIKILGVLFRLFRFYHIVCSVCSHDLGITAPQITTCRDWQLYGNKITAPQAAITSLDSRHCSVACCWW